MTVRSLRTCPVFTVVRGSSNTTSHSSSATGCARRRVARLGTRPLRSTLPGHGSLAEKPAGAGGALHAEELEGPEPLHRRRRPRDRQQRHRTHDPRCRGRTQQLGLLWKRPRWQNGRSAAQLRGVVPAGLESIPSPGSKTSSPESLSIPSPDSRNSCRIGTVSSSAAEGGQSAA
jgi:hypothetical protein